MLFEPVDDDIVARILVEDGEGPPETVVQIVVEQSLDPAERLRQCQAVFIWEIILASAE